MTDGIPPDRRCPICGALNVNPHPHSLCPDHYPGEPPEVTPIGEGADGDGDEGALQEAKAVAGEQDPTSEAAPSADWAVADQILQRHGDDGRDDPDEAADGSFLAAAMGDEAAAEQYQKETAAPARRALESENTAGGVGLPTGALPLAQLDALDPEQRRRAARRRGLEWPSTEEARERLEATIFQVIRQADHRVVDAPTALGKTHTVAATRWGARDDITGGRPVVHLLETREARDEAVEIAEEHGGRYLKLESRHEACPVAAGEYDPPDDDGRELGELDYRPITIDGEPASEWLERVCDGRGIPFSAAHRYLQANNDQDTALPCCEEGECQAIAQWRRYREGEYPLVIATHNFAFAPGLRLGNNLVVDEEPDYQQDLSTERVRRAVGAYLRAIDAPVTTWEQFMQLATFDPDTWDDVSQDIAREREQLEDALNAEPDREWYFENQDAHVLAPALARAILHSEERPNGRRAGGPIPYEPPRLEANARDDDAWNREFVTVVLDDATNDVRTVRVRPDFGAARSVVGLDAHPAIPKWQANTVPWIKTVDDRFVYTGDTAPMEDIAGFAAGCELLVHECSFPREGEGGHWHTNPYTLAPVVADADVDRLYLVHVPELTDAERAEIRDVIGDRFDGEVVIPDDMETVPIGR